MNTRIVSHLFLSIAVSALPLLSSCTLQKNLKKAEVVVETQEKEVPKPPLFDWEDESTTGKAAVKISLSEQKAYVYRGGKRVAWTMLASGVAGHESPTGSFTILEKIAKKKSNLYGIIVDADGDVVNWDAKAGVSRIPKGGKFVGAPMPHWMRITSSGVGMHEGNIPNPGSPASHGCIRLPGEMAAKLFEVVEVGTPVTITGAAPD
jgi:lipoprotein-anchoring transpeptidase ErfK/SrfK